MEPFAPKFKHYNIHLTQSTRRDNIYKFCSWMSEEHTSEAEISRYCSKNNNLSYIV